jgi:Gpi18-like mannosyltransferase
VKTHRTRSAISNLKDIGTIGVPLGSGYSVTPTETPDENRRLAIALAVGSTLAGLTLRYLAREHATNDAVHYLIPWYAFAREHGVSGLREAFTNYTPFYSYVLLIATQFDWLAQPLSLVKAISAVFEFGCAIVVAQIVWQATRLPLRASIAFCGAWLAPTVIFNGAAWGQADSIWTFFTLLSVSLFMRDRNGVLPFAIAFAVKAQGVFLGPFVLGMMLRRRIHWTWLAAVPAVYVILAIPVVLAGRPFASVLKVYMDQADTFHRLSMNAANIWVLAGDVPYAIGVAVGLVLAAASGLALSVFIMRSRQDGPDFILLAACASLMLMPFLLPKMHERYFYAFELASIALACVNPRYLPFAVIAQIDGVLSYLGFDREIVMGLLPAALCNTLLGCYLVLDLWRGERGFRFPKVAWLGFAASTAGLFCYLFLADRGWNVSPIFLVATGVVTTMALMVIKESRGAEAGIPIR